ncbi:MAG: peptidoglycan-binding domain-containing protein [Candidatus Sericytochromatia bacterium]|nr:peptidoglycan-binding domain-containing protein [Candidatus Sericytochromatia bacterium]
MKPSLTEQAAPAAPESPQVATAAAPIAEAPAAAQAGRPIITIAMFQQRLSEHGFYGGMMDGDYGPYTKFAVARFQASNGLPADGEPTPATLEALGLA